MRTVAPQHLVHLACPAFAHRLELVIQQGGEGGEFAAGNLRGLLAKRTVEDGDAIGFQFVERHGDTSVDAVISVGSPLEVGRVLEGHGIGAAESLEEVRVRVEVFTDDGNTDLFLTTGESLLLAAECGEQWLVLDGLVECVTLDVEIEGRRGDGLKLTGGDAGC